MDELHIEQTVAAAAAGEPWALRALYDELAPRVQGFLRARGARDPEDLTSEVFLAVFPRLDTVTGGAAGLRSFVFSVAHARLVDDLRKRSRRPETTEFEPDHHSGAVPSAEDTALVAMSEEFASEMLSRLPEIQRSVIYLRVVAQLSLDEVATVIGRSEGAVKQLQRRALLTLKEHLTEAGVPG